MSDCLFCRIAAGEVPSDRVAEGDGWIAFRDIDPQAPTHVLVIPTEHVESLNAADDLSGEWLGQLLDACRTVAAREGVADAGYRVVTNTNRAGGQAVPHLHFHVLGGREMGWPPG